MKFRTLVIHSLIAVFLAGVLMQAQSSLEIRAASATAVAGWQAMPAPCGGTLWVSPASALTAAAKSCASQFLIMGSMRCACH